MGRYLPVVNLPCDTTIRYWIQYAFDMDVLDSGNENKARLKAQVQQCT
jgi:hypothetical protein